MADRLICWELASTDPEASAEFFRRVFGWDVCFDARRGFHQTDPPVGENPAHGFITAGSIFPGRPPHAPLLMLGIQVDDIHARALLVRQFGGHIVEGPERTSPGTQVCLFTDPSGITFAMIEEDAPD
jgi:predicted enzyme related to lactoylglutathione lyase